MSSIAQNIYWIKLSRLIGNLSYNSAWVIVFYLTYRSFLKKEYSFSKINLFKWSKWHNRAIHLVAFDNIRQSLVFIKTGSIHRTSSNEFYMASLFFSNNPELTAKPVYYLSDHPSKSIVFDFLDGMTLTNAIESSTVGTIVPWDTIVTKIVSILTELNNLRMIHRDITPNNILVKYDENTISVYIIDFSFAITTSNSSTDAYIGIDELLYLGLNYKPDNYVWDDAYSVLSIVEYIEAQLGLSFPKHKEYIEGLVGDLVYSSVSTSQ